MQQPETIQQKIDRFREEGKRYRKGFETDWNECEEFYSGLQWKQRDPSLRAKNFVFQIIESQVPILMDPMPATDIIAMDDTPEAQDKTIVLNAAKDHVYREQNLFLKDVQAIRDMTKTGNGWQYVDFDPDGENGEGSVVVRNLTWSQVILDPAAETVDQCRYAIIDVPLSNDELKRLYPKTAEESKNMPLKDIYVFSDSKYNREDQNTGANSTSDSSRFESKDMTFVEECWLRDYSMEEISDDDTQIELTKETVQLQQGVNPDVSKWEDHPKHIEGHREQKAFILAEALQVPVEQLTDQDLETAMQDPELSLLLNIIDDHIRMHEMYAEEMDSDELGKKPKYKNNLRLVVKTGPVIHYDGAPDVEDGLIPLVAWQCYKGQKIYADGDIKNIIPIQKSINEIDHKELKGLKLVANPGWLVDEQSKVDTDTLTDEDGIVVTKQQGTEVQRIQPGQVSSQLADRVTRDYEAAQRIAGSGETVFGEAPKTQTSGVLWKRIQMQALGRIRLKSKMIESAVQRRDQLIMSRIVSKWSNERLLRSEDNSGKIRFIKFRPDEIRDMKYDQILAPGTTAGMDNETIAETYKELLQGQLIDLRTFAEITNLPKKQALLEALDRQDQTKAELQRLQEENLQLKAQFAPQALTPEEVEILNQQPAVG